MDPIAALARAFLAVLAILAVLWLADGPQPAPVEERIQQGLE
jgi:hypothetical protein